VHSQGLDKRVQFAGILKNRKTGGKNGNFAGIFAAGFPNFVHDSHKVKKSVMRHAEDYERKSNCSGTDAKRVQGILSHTEAMPCLWTRVLGAPVSEVLFASLLPSGVFALPLLAEERSGAPT